MKGISMSDRKHRVVIALGHKALGTTLPEQQKAAAIAAKAIADYIEKDCEVIVTHSNGPQVGMIRNAMNEYHKNHPEYTATPMAICSAMSQGFIGYDLQNAISYELLSRGISKGIVSLPTRVIVDPYDEAFYEPTKIIGHLMNKAEADEEEARGNHITEVEGGYKRIVASPKPLDIIEIDAIKTLLSSGQAVIAAGGGGIPVLMQGHALKGASAVIEKDLTAGLLATLVEADELVFLTGEKYVCRHFGTPAETPISGMTVAEAKADIESKAFGDKADGTVLPKIIAAVDFVGDDKNKKAVIAKMEDDGTLTGGTIIKA